MSKVDKIIGQFVKTMDSLESEAIRLDGVAIRQRGVATEATANAVAADNEAGRAMRISAKLGAIINE